ncbi:MAG: ABC transporter ATP-binding protein [Spiribacter sp.]|nr:ABC transporter ATP-binding protein [Spiribacter sp.]MDR9489922.1 ABC transporter ATP-binding protein [Spiribacter sp.]
MSAPQENLVARFPAGGVAASQAPCPTPSGEALALEEISHNFENITAADDVNLSVEPEELLCLLGPSGCGKTTLLRFAAGLERPQAGRVRIGSQLMSDSAASTWVPPEQRHVGLVFQDAVLFPHLSVLDNVSFGLPKIAPREREQRSRALLAQLGLAPFAESFPHILSGGQQQRVALARALAPSPRIMLLDEPFSGLDARLRDRIRDDTLHLLKRNGTATLLVTHDPEEALFMADRIAVMREGRIVQQGHPTDIYCNPIDPFVVRFFGDVNEMRGIVVDGRVDTPTGPIAANHLADGTAVQVLIRPEALRVEKLSGPRDHTRSHVLMSRLLGGASFIHLCVHQGNDEYHMHAHMPGVFLPERNDPIAVHLDPTQAFVFPIQP